MESNPLKSKQNIKILYIRPPYHLWPLLNKSDNVLAPLNLATIAGYIRSKVPDVTQKIVDCCNEEIGFKTLYKILEEEKPDIVGVGDMICYHIEGVKTLELAKKANPNCVTVAGGPFFSHVPEYTLNNFPHIDFIVRYEGEESFRELIDCLREDKDVKQVKGIAYKEDEKIIETPPRPLIEDLDSLPYPAYDLLNVNNYSPFGMFLRRAMPAQASRGCLFGCEYCTWSHTEGEHFLDENGELKFTPRIRYKSPERVVEEIGYLHEKWNVPFFFWCDGTWNFSTEWQDTFSDLILAKKYKIKSFAFTRADLLLEQEKAGVLAKMVKAGLIHCLFGPERATDEELKKIGKKGISANTFIECCHMLEKKYPQVFRQATFITGLPDDKPEDFDKLFEYILKSHVDFAPVHAIMPYPGTPSFEKYKEYIEEWDFSKWDMFYPVIRTKYMSREEVSSHIKRIQMDFVSKQKIKYLKGLLSPHTQRRRLHWWLAYSFAKLYIRDFVLALLGKKKYEGYAGIQKLWKPKWYDS